MGISVGDFVGGRDGASVGSCVGVSVGSTGGAGTGSSAGTDDGTSVGLRVGTTVGTCDECKTTLQREAENPARSRKPVVDAANLCARNRWDLRWCQRRCRRRTVRWRIRRRGRRRSRGRGRGLGCVEGNIPRARCLPAATRCRQQLRQGGGLSVGGTLLEVVRRRLGLLQLAGCGCTGRRNRAATGIQPLPVALGRRQLLLLQCQPRLLQLPIEPFRLLLLLVGVAAQCAARARDSACTSIADSNSASGPVESVKRTRRAARNTSGSAQERERRATHRTEQGARHRRHQETRKRNARTYARTQAVSPHAHA